MDRLFSTLGNSPLLLTTDSASNSLVPQSADVWRPLVDVKSTDNEIQIHAELPGVKKEDIDLELKDGLLTISGKRVEEKKEENEKYHKSERFYGNFKRSFAVPQNVNENDIKAHFDNGVLQVSFPKPSVKEPEKKRIKVQ